MPVSPAVALKQTQAIVKDLRKDPTKWEALDAAWEFFLQKRRDQSLHSLYDDAFVEAGGPELIAAHMASGDPKKQEAMVPVLLGITSGHCPKSSIAICANKATMSAMADIMRTKKGDMTVYFTQFRVAYSARGLWAKVFSYLSAHEENHAILEALNLKQLFIEATKTESATTFAATLFLANVFGNREDSAADAALVSSAANMSHIVSTLAVGHDRFNTQWFPSDLAPPLRRLALSDHNKEMLREAKIFPPLKRVLCCDEVVGDSVTYKEMLLLVVNLAFDSSNKIEMKREKFDDVIENLAIHPATKPQHMKLIEQLRWMLNPPPEPEKGSRRANVATKPGVSGVVGEGAQVMLSYNWDNQPRVIALAEKLKQAGIRVWLDVEQMEGSTMAAMADAVETSQVVVVCVSRKYKESSNCRLEGEYAYQKRKEIVPLMMEENYAADGWLGALLGTKLWYDCTSDELMHRNIESAIAAIRKRLGTSSTAPTAPSAPAPRASPVTWSEAEVAAWLAKVLPEEHTALEGLAKLTGQSMHQLATWSRRDASFYYKMLSMVCPGVAENLSLFSRLTYHLENNW